MTELTALMALASAPVAAGDSFWDHNGNWITAAATVVIALIAAQVVDHLIARHAKPMALKVKTGDLSAVAVTRLRLVRRLVFVVIIVIGIALAIAQFSDLRRLATGLLASSAVLGIVLGFAARQTLANGIAGILVAIVQPIRVGDVVEWEGTRGVVEDLTLTYTFLRLGDGRRLVVPNERIASGPIFNWSMADRLVDADARLFVPSRHASAAISVLREQIEGCTVTIGEIDRDRTQLSVSRPVTPDAQPGEVEEILERALEALSQRELLWEPPAV